MIRVNNKRLLFSILAIGIITTSQSQINLGEAGQGGAINFVTASSANETESKTEGSPYLNPQFTPGKILIDGEVKFSGLLRFNGYSQEIQIKETETKYGILTKSPKYSAIIDDVLFEIKTYITDKEQVRSSYFMVLNEGKTQLLLKPQVKLRRGRKAETPYERNESPRFFPSFTYYVTKNTEPATEIKLNRSQILSVLKDSKSSVEKFVEDADLNYKKEEDVIQIIKAYNVL